MSWEELRDEVGDEKLVCFDGFVYDVKSSADMHPGDEAMICGFVGKDATVAFNGGVYARTSKYFVGSFPSLLGDTNR
jgi:stearoyl-CoA desaturase (delta-9 desaturase)